MGGFKKWLQGNIWTGKARVQEKWVRLGFVRMGCSTRFVVKPEGVSNVVLTTFDFVGGVNEKLGVERHQGGNLPPPPTNRALMGCENC